jgi:hypothetical protein
MVSDGDSTWPVRSDPPSLGHAIALAIKKGVPTEVAVDSQSPALWVSASRLISRL